MTDEKVVQLAEQVRECFRNVPPSVDLACTVVTYQDEIVKCALEAAYALGRRDGLEEAAKECERSAEGHAKPNELGVKCHHIDAIRIRRLIDPASISSSANSVEGKKE